MTPSPFLRVARKAPCPICGKPDWCSLVAETPDTICMRVWSEHPTKNGGYLHIGHGSAHAVTPIPRSQSRNLYSREREGSTVQAFNRAYSALAERLHLSERAADDLRRRGLTEEAVVNQLYATIPAEPTMREVISEISSIVELDGVPGFYFARGEWRLNAREGDLLIPIRDAAGRIAGCQLRSDDTGPRYRWLSSAGQPNGAAAKAQPHFALPYLVQWQRVAIITEGPLKADVVADRLHRAVVGIPGVSNFSSDIGSVLRVTWPRLMVAVVAYDADAMTNPTVMTALRKLVTALMRAGLDVRVWTWDRAVAKGLDDLLNAEAA